MQTLFCTIKRNIVNRHQQHRNANKNKHANNILRNRRRRGPGKMPAVIRILCGHFLSKSKMNDN